MITIPVFLFNAAMVKDQGRKLLIYEIFKSF